MAAEDFVRYLNSAVTPYHCVAECKSRLTAAGFEELDEKTVWALKRLGKYFFVRNGSAIVAFGVGGLYDASTSGAIIVGAHTDSPCPRLKPRHKLEKSGHHMLGVVGYGGGLWHTWFDRDLTVGGRAVVNGHSKLVYVDKPLCRIPNLAIHLCTPEERSTFKPNLQQHLPPMLSTTAHESPLLKVVAENIGEKPEDIVDVELQLCDTQKAVVGGAYDEFVFSGRLDNQACCYFGLTALIEATQNLEDSPSIMCLALFDHEEVGSQSATGAQGPLLKGALLRIPPALGSTVPDVGSAAFTARSFLISADMAHAHHPNYADRHDPEHAPKLGKGLVIKFNANQRYATDCFGAVFLRACASKADVAPCQEFAVRADTACGSTIGPISSANIGIRTVDVGAPQLSMHSIREQMHVEDIQHSIKVLQAAYTHFHTLANDDFKDLF